MAMEKYNDGNISDWDLPLINGLLGRSGKRRRIMTSSESENPRIPPTTINHLGDDLLVEILIRGLRHPRSASRCKLVCKRWSSLISGPRFNRRFVSRGQNRVQTMPDDPLWLLRIIRSFLPPMPDGVGDTLTVFDCNKDLVLCGFEKLDFDRDFGKLEINRSYLVCNPFTKQWIALPLAPRKFHVSLFMQATLVCEPRLSSKLDLGDDQAPFVYSEHRFRVVRMCQRNAFTSLDVFCSESGEWINEALVWNDHIQCGLAVSCNGELFWKYFRRCNRGNILVARFNPFCLDLPPTSIDVSSFLVNPKWCISVSEDALHVITLENKTLPGRLTVWRLEEDGKSWRQRSDILVVTKPHREYKVGKKYQHFLHPHKLEIFLELWDGNKKAILCCDLMRKAEELEFVTKQIGLSGYHNYRVFQPRISCWPTPIPRYKELQGVYDGSCSFLVQSKSTEAKTLPLPPSLNNCVDHVMKSAIYKDYIEHVTAEATLQIVTEIIRHRRNEIGDETPRYRRPRSPVFDDEWDVMKADMADAEADISSLGKQKEALKQELVRETLPQLPYPPPAGPIKSVIRRREQYRWGMNHIIGAIVGRIRPLFSNTARP